MRLRTLSKRNGSAGNARRILQPGAQEPAPNVAHVTALAGGEALLPCDLSPDNDSVALVLWYKDALPTPVYSVDARRGDVSQARHSSIAWGTRAYFVTQPTPGLRLQALAVTDSGVYRCRVDFRKDRTRNHESSLLVIEPPGTPVIREAVGDREPLRSLIGPYNEGDSLALVCDVEGGVPEPSVTWWRESVPLESVLTEHRPGVRRSALGPFVLRRQDLMAVLVCQASNSNLTSPLTTSVTLDMNFRPLEVSVEAVSPTLEAGKTGWLSCRAVGSRPRSRITWLLGDQVLTGARQNESLDGNVTLSWLALRPTARHHGRMLRCRADNDLIPGSDIFAEFRLQVLFPPKLTLRLASSLRRSQLREGQDVYLECVVEANPPVSDVSWWFGDRELFTDSTGGVLVNNRSLVLQKVRLDARGPYSCSAANSQGQGSSNTLFLNFHYAPVCRRGQPQVYGAASNQPVRVNCEVQSEPAPTSFHWRLGNESLTNFTSLGHSSHVTLVPRRIPQDLTKRLLCWATNDVGTQREPCAFSLVPARDPETPRNCSLHNRTASAFAVECEPGDDGGMPPVYVLQVLDQFNRSVLQANASDRPAWTVSGLNSGTRLSVMLYAVTSKGRSPLTLLRIKTLAGSQSLTEPLWSGSLSPILVALIACAVGLVAIVFLVTVLLRYRSAKERHKPEPIKGDDELQIAPLHQYPDGVLKLRSPQSEEKCPDVVLDVSGSDERLKEEEDRPSEAVRWKGWTEADAEHDKAMLGRSPLQEYQSKNGGQTRAVLSEPVSTAVSTVVPSPVAAPAVAVPPTLCAETTVDEVSECVVVPPPLKYRQTIV
ncbi:cell surface glycoprotein MUC18-like isoform X2 [Dermacentor albipictus]|uniref:cell surface glycoprotein MUC18-like isoform X2 n=1 Tax=Dermacentor albipictus TaxID=60249 RepID=UPI0038FC6755